MLRKHNVHCNTMITWTIMGKKEDVHTGGVIRFLFVCCNEVHVSINLIPTVDVFMLGHISSLIAHVVYSQLPSCS